MVIAPTNIFQENILMALRGEVEEGAASSSTPARIVYVLHPNCAVEDW